MSVTSTQVKISSTPYSQERHLLFQFILTELMITCDKVRQMNQFSKEKNEEGKEKIIGNLTELVGPAQGQMRLFSWPQDGSLAKLKHYCALLCQACDVHDVQFIQLHEEAHQAWRLSVQLFDLLKPSLPVFKAKKNPSATTILRRLSRSIEKLGKKVVRIIQDFRHDENVIYFMLRHHQQLDSLYGENFVARLFKKFFPQKNKGVGEFLIQRYTERGFSHLIPVIQEELREFLK